MKWRPRSFFIEHAHHARTIADEDPRVPPERRETSALHGRAGADGVSRVREQQQ
jgi:hypothetical protein